MVAAMEDPVAQLQKRVERYLKKTQKSATAFGIEVGKNTSLVKRIRDGEIGLKTIRIVSAYLDQHERV